MKKLFYWLVAQLIGVLVKKSSLFCQICYENGNDFFILVPIRNEWEKQKWVYKKPNYNSKKDLDNSLNYEMNLEIPNNYLGNNFDYLCEMVEDILY